MSSTKEVAFVNYLRKGAAIPIILDSRNDKILDIFNKAFKLTYCISLQQSNSLSLFFPIQILVSYHKQKVVI